MRPGWIRSLWHDVWSLPVVLRCLVVGGVVGAVLGGVTGLVLGLLAHPPTAWFAVLELGAPGACIGVLLGLAVGSVARLRAKTP